MLNLLQKEKKVLDAGCGDHAVSYGSKSGPSTIISTVTLARTPRRGAEAGRRPALPGDETLHERRNSGNLTAND
jgi:hypothetical protein